MKHTKEDNRIIIELIGQHIKRHRVLSIVVLSFILMIALAFTIVWFLSNDELPIHKEIWFYASQGVFMVVTALAITFLVLEKRHKYSNKFLVIASHAYVFFMIAVATVICCFDLGLGYSPLTYLFIMTFVGGIFTLNPIFFGIVELLSLVPIYFFAVKYPDLFFNGEYLMENIIVLVAFVLLVGVLCFKNYKVIRIDYALTKKLHELSYIDELTGLLNERSYIDAITEIDERIKSKEEVKFAVVMMDVNNLKATNDAYGHQYGCSLVVRCGHTLPTLFKEPTKLFHIGGDEFLAIVMGEDLDNFDKLMAKFDKAMLYSVVKFKGQKLIFSVARGFHIREKGESFKDVLQIADEEMYKNKKMLKEKYHMQSR